MITALVESCTDCVNRFKTVNTLPDVFAKKTIILEGYENGRIEAHKDDDGNDEHIFVPECDLQKEKIDDYKKWGEFKEIPLVIKYEYRECNSRCKKLQFERTCYQQVKSLEEYIEEQKLEVK